MRLALLGRSRLSSQPLLLLTVSIILFNLSKFSLCFRKPVYVIGADRCTWKFADFQKTLRERGVVRPFTGKEDVSNLMHHACIILSADY